MRPGTKPKLASFCRLARGTPQWPGSLDWFSKSEHSDPIVFEDSLMHYTVTLIEYLRCIDDA